MLITPKSRIRPTQKVCKLIRLMQMLCDEDLCAYEVSERLDISERAVYRYVHTLRRAGVGIVFDGGILSLSYCPLCRKTVNKKL